MGMGKFIVFVVCGGVAAMANIALRWFFSHFISYKAAIVAAYGIGMLMAFTLFKFFVFASSTSKKTFKESLWYMLVNAVALAQTFLVSIGLADYVFPAMGMTFYPADLAHIIGVGVPVITSYWGHKHFTFRK